MANLDASWAVTNGLTTQGNPTWLNLYLAACKLLDVALILPSEVIPQFQLYRWAFTGDPGADEHTTSDKNKRAKEQLQLPAFVPHVFRISKLMNQMVILPFSFILCIVKYWKWPPTLTWMSRNVELLFPRFYKQETFLSIYLSVWTNCRNTRCWSASTIEH